MTLGNHAWDQREALVFIERERRSLRPANWPAGTPGRGAAVLETKAGARILVVNLMGRVFMGLADDPFAAAEREIAACPLGTGESDAAAVVDIHQTDRAGPGPWGVAGPGPRRRRPLPFADG